MTHEVANTQPLVTVLMTAFNAGEYLSEAVDSLTRQTFLKWQLILIDNGSTDNSFALLNSDDPRIRVLKSSINIGRTKALQLALSYADTPFVAILDADDISHPDRLSQQLSIFVTSPDVVLIGSHVTLLLEGGVKSRRVNEYVGVISHDQLAERNPFVHSSVMFRTSAVVAVGGYDDNYPYAQDYDLFQRLAAIGQCQILQSQLISLRVHPRSMTNGRTSALLRLKDEAALFSLAQFRLQMSTRGRRMNRRRRALVYLEMGFYAILDGQTLGGLKALARSIKVDPSLSWILYILQGRPIPKL